MAISRQRHVTGYRSKSARSAAALSTRLFGARPEASAPWRNDDPQSQIRTALRRRRRALGLTQDAAARLLGMPRLTYHRIETGARHIHFADLAAICEMFDCTPGGLLQDTRLTAAFAYAATALLGQAST
jgi:DNA-binding Xre family transcriptional regulator